MKFAGWYSTVVGIMMLGQWGFFLGTNQVPELRTAPIALGFHLTAEAVTAIALLVGGIGLLRRKTWARMVDLIALGMLAYTAITSPGYFAQQGTWPLVAMFTVLLALMVVSAVLLIREMQNAPAHSSSKIGKSGSKRYA
jgi:amino acid permease